MQTTIHSTEVESLYVRPAVTLEEATHSKHSELREGEHRVLNWALTYIHPHDNHPSMVG